MTSPKNERQANGTPVHHHEAEIATGVKSAAVARLILTESAVGRDSDRSADLIAAANALRGGAAMVKYLLTPAGFVHVRHEHGWDGGKVGWDTSQDDFDALAAEARDATSKLLTETVRTSLSHVADYLSIGIDVFFNVVRDREPHAEYALIVRLKDGAIEHMTGKSYPTSKQQMVLIRQPAAETHAVLHDQDALALLVCHDLMTYGGRARAVRGGRRGRVGLALETAIASTAPTVALHLAHTVATSRTWASPWATLIDEHPGLRAWSTAFRYSDLWNRPLPLPVPRRVLAATAGGAHGVLDIILRDAR